MIHPHESTPERQNPLESKTFHTPPSFMEILMKLKRAELDKTFPNNKTVNQ